MDAYTGEAQIVYIKKYGTGEPTDIMVEALYRDIQDKELRALPLEMQGVFKAYNRLKSNGKITRLNSVLADILGCDASVVYDELEIHKDPPALCIACDAALYGKTVV